MKMGPHMADEEKSSLSSYDEEWRIGYDVQMNGIAIEHFYHEDASSHSNSDVGQDNDSFYSNGDENDSSSELNIIDATRAGYQPLQFEVTDDAVGDSVNKLTETQLTSLPIRTDTIVNTSQATCDAQVQLFGRALELPLLPEDVKSVPAIPHQPVDFALNNDKIDEIKSIMSQLNIAPSPWAFALKDESLMELVHKLKNSH